MNLFSRNPLMPCVLVTNSFRSAFSTLKPVKIIALALWDKSFHKYLLPMQRPQNAVVPVMPKYLLTFVSNTAREINFDLRLCESKWTLRALMFLPHLVSRPMDFVNNSSLVWRLCLRPGIWKLSISTWLQFIIFHTSLENNRDEATWGVYI